MLPRVPPSLSATFCLINVTLRDTGVSFRDTGRYVRCMTFSFFVFNNSCPDDSTKQAVRTFVEAFKDGMVHVLRPTNIRLTAIPISDSFVTACSGGDDDYFERLIYSIFLAAYRGGQVYVASYGEHMFAGVAAWFPPGQGLFHTCVFSLLRGRTLLTFCYGMFKA